MDQPMCPEPSCSTCGSRWAAGKRRSRAFWPPGNPRLPRRRFEACCGWRNSGSCGSWIRTAAHEKGRPGAAFLFLMEPVGLLGRRRQLADLSVGFGALLLQDQLVAMSRDGLDLRVQRTGAGWDQAADDHVFLQALEGVHLAVDRRLREDAGGLLEGSRRDEGAGLQRGLGDAEENRRAGG